MALSSPAGPAEYTRLPLWLPDDPSTLSQSQAKASIQALLDRHAYSTRTHGSSFPISNPESKEFKCLRYLLEQHPNSATKIGPGISHFSINFGPVHPYPPSWHFTVHRTDGSETYFSYKGCLENWGITRQNIDHPSSSTAALAAAAAADARAVTIDDIFEAMSGLRLSTQPPHSRSYVGTPAARAALAAASQEEDGYPTHAPTIHKQKCLQALKFAVRDQLQEFKWQAFEGRDRFPCSATGVLLTIDDAVAGYAPPVTFASLVADWMQSEGIDFLQLQRSMADNTSGGTLRNYRQWESWRAFHRRSASLRVLSRAAHAKLSKELNRERQWAEAAAAER